MRTLKGFSFYHTGFLANDPEYTFEKCGEESKAEIEQFKTKNAKKIKERRVELGLEEAEDASLGNETLENKIAIDNEGAPPAVHQSTLDVP